MLSKYIFPSKGVLFPHFQTYGETVPKTRNIYTLPRMAYIHNIPVPMRSAKKSVDISIKRPKCQDSFGPNQGQDIIHTSSLFYYMCKCFFFCIGFKIIFRSNQDKLSLDANKIHLFSCSVGIHWTVTFEIVYKMEKFSQISSLKIATVKAFFSPAKILQIKRGVICFKTIPTMPFTTQERYTKLFIHINMCQMVRFSWTLFYIFFVAVFKGF